MTIVTIDGPSGVGKGTIAKIISQFLGFYYLDSGAMYRALALFADLHGINTADDKRLKKLLIDLHVRFVKENGKDKVFINSDDVTDDSSMVELLGRPVTIFNGSPMNIKVTTREDLLLAEAILKTKIL